MSSAATRKRGSDELMTKIPEGTFGGFFGWFKRRREDTNRDEFDTLQNKIPPTEQVATNTTKSSSGTIAVGKVPFRNGAAKDRSVVQLTERSDAHQDDRSQSFVRGESKGELFAQRLRDRFSDNLVAFLPHQPRGLRAAESSSLYRQERTELLSRINRSYRRPNWSRTNSYSTSFQGTQARSKNSTPFRSTLSSWNAEKYAELHRNKEAQVRQVREWLAKGLLGAEPAIVRVEPLSARDKKTVFAHWNSADPDTKLIGEAFRVQLSLGDLRTLQERNWLNDNVIDMYLAGVCSSREITPGSCFAFTTHFYTKLSEQGYKSVSKWAKRKKIDVTKLDYLLVPVNKGNMHWCLGVVNNKEKKFQYYDSFHGSGKEAIAHLQDYMVEEADRLEPGKHDAHVALYSSYQEVPEEKTPTQTNGSDCGVFLCQTATCVANGGAPNFSQSDMPELRQKLAFALLEHTGLSTARL